MKYLIPTLIIFLVLLFSIWALRRARQIENNGQNSSLNQVSKKTSPLPEGETRSQGPISNEIQGQPTPLVIDMPDMEVGLYEIGRPEDIAIDIWQKIPCENPLARQSVLENFDKLTIEGIDLISDNQFRLLREAVATEITLIQLNSPKQYIENAAARGEFIPEDTEKQFQAVVEENNYPLINTNTSLTSFEIVWINEIKEPFWTGISGYQHNECYIFQYSGEPEKLRSFLENQDSQHIFAKSFGEKGYRKITHTAVSAFTEVDALKEYGKVIYCDFVFYVKTNSPKPVNIPQNLRLWWDEKNKIWHPSQLISPSEKAVGPLIF